MGGLTRASLQHHTRTPWTDAPDEPREETLPPPASPVQLANRLEEPRSCTHRFAGPYGENAFLEVMGLFHVTR